MNYFLMSRRTLLCLIAIGMGAATTSSFGGAVAQKSTASEGSRVTAAVTKALRDKITSPNGNLQLEVKPSAQAARGYFTEIHIAGRPIKVKNLRVSEFDMRARDVQVDLPALWKTGKVETLKSNTKLRAVISEDDLTQMLAAGQFSASMGLTVKFTKHPQWGDVMQVAGRWNAFMLSGPVTGMGRLKLAPGSKVNLEILSMTLNGIESPQALKNKFMEKLNPVIDYNDVPFKAKFNSLKVQGNKAILTAG